MSDKEKVHQAIENFLDNTYLDVQGMGTTGATAVSSEDYVITLVTKIAVGACTAWWSMRELGDYIQKRKEYKETVNDGPGAP